MTGAVNLRFFLDMSIVRKQKGRDSEFVVYRKKGSDYVACEIPGLCVGAACAFESVALDSTADALACLAYRRQRIIGG
jgi:hypothetical protein